jgi:hypothetical protein
MKLKWPTLLLVLPLIAGSCKDSTGPARLSLSAIVGTWDLTAYEWTSLTNPNNKHDFYADGYRDVLAIRSGGVAVETFTDPGFGTFVDSVRLVVKADSIYFLFPVDAPSDTSRYAVTLAGSVLTLLGRFGSQWEFTPGTFEEVSERLVYRRR